MPFEIRQALSRACIRRSVRIVLVNPAYTSIIGLVKFAPRYGSSVHAAAALAIARRAMALSERLPASGESISVLLASGDRVTLPRPARIARRHVWSSWSRLARGLSAVHEGRRGRAVGRDRAEPEVLRPPAIVRRGPADASPSPVRGAIPLRSEVRGYGLTSPPPDRSLLADAEVRIPHRNPDSLRMSHR